ncbi:MAG: hypothetical protein JKY33_10300 [Bacteroidia bacterium]|nr:hypothetical protein [Bacteroidia bacterium]
MRYFIGLILLVVSFNAHSYKNVKCLLHLKKSLQHDTLGTNLVEHLPPLVYAQIMGGNVKLWDSPNKEIQLSSETLGQIEKSSQTYFTHCDDLFLLELWSTSAKSIKIQPLGFYFINRNRNGEKISYGFVEFEELRAALNNNLIPVNANGFVNASFFDILRNRKFDYNMVQFGNLKVTDVIQSNRIKSEAFYGKKYTYSELDPKEVIQEKLITYTIKPAKLTVDSIDVRSDNSRAFLDSIRMYLLNNLEVFYNSGGSNVISHIEKNIDFKVTKVQVEEYWKKDEFGNIECNTDVFILWINDKVALNGVSLQTMQNWGIVINNQVIGEFVNRKKFTFNIDKINRSDIKRRESAKYFQALKDYHWDRLTEYVAYY